MCTVSNADVKSLEKAVDYNRKPTSSSSYSGNDETQSSSGYKKDVKVINSHYEFNYRKFEAKDFEPWYNMIIRPNGRVGPCGMFDFSEEYIHDKSLEEVWNGHYFTKVRENLKKGILMGYCKKCNHGQVVENKKINELLKYF